MRIPGLLFLLLLANRRHLASALGGNTPWNGQVVAASEDAATARQASGGNNPWNGEAAAASEDAAEARQVLLPRSPRSTRSRARGEFVANQPAKVIGGPTMGPVGNGTAIGFKGPVRSLEGRQGVYWDSQGFEGPARDLDSCLGVCWGLQGSGRPPRGLLGQPGVWKAAQGSRVKNRRHEETET